MTAAGSGLGWPDLVRATVAGLDVGSAVGGVGWPEKDADEQGRARHRTGEAGAAGGICAAGGDGAAFVAFVAVAVGGPASEFSAHEQPNRLIARAASQEDHLPWRPDRGQGKSGEEERTPSMAIYGEGETVVRGTGTTPSGLGWPTVRDAAGADSVAWRSGPSGSGRGLGWPAIASGKRRDGAPGLPMAVSRETVQPASSELFGMPADEVAATAGEGGGKHDPCGGTSRLGSWYRRWSASRDEADAPSSADLEPSADPEPSADLEPTSTETASDVAGFAGEQLAADRDESEADRADRTGGPSASAGEFDLPSWSANPSHGTSLAWQQAGASELMSAQAAEFGAEGTKTESPATVKETEQSILGAWQPEPQDGPMIAGTYSGAERAQGESEDEVATSAAPGTSADPPIARAAQAAMEARTKSKPWPRPHACRILTIANQKGGVGKTTTAVNLAASLAMHGSRVLVVDLDPQGNASTALDVEHRSGISSIYNVLVDGLPLAKVIRPVQDFALLHCAPATIDLAGAEIELVPLVARESRLARAVAEYDASNMDYIFIDCPPSLGLLTVNALVAAPEVLIPIQCEYYALEGLEQLLRTIELVKSHLNPGLKVSTILLTMFDSRTRLASQVADEVRGHFGGLVLQSVIPRSVRVSEAPSYGQSVMTYDPGSSGALAYLEAAREMAFSNSKAATA